VLRAQQHAGPIVGTEASVPSFLFRCTMDASTQSIGCVVETVAGQPPWSASNIRSCRVFAGRSIAAVWVDPRRREILRNEVRQCPLRIICKPNSILRLPTRLISRRDQRISEFDEAGQLRTQVHRLSQYSRRSQDNIEIRRRGGTIDRRGRFVSEHLSKEQCSMADTESEQGGQLSVGEVRSE